MPTTADSGAELSHDPEVEHDALLRIYVGGHTTQEDKNMATIILVAHGNQRSGAFSNPRVRIITKSGQPLTFDEARAYLGGGAAPEYASSSLGDYGRLTNADCNALFGMVPAAGPGYVNTGRRRGGDMAGYEIFALRGQDVSFAEIGVFAAGYDKVILVACRS